MSIDKSTSRPSIHPTNRVNGPERGVGAAGSTNSPGSGGKVDEFRRALDEALAPQGVVRSPAISAPVSSRSPQATSGAGTLKFSHHAIERMHSRGIAFAPDEMKSIENAITKAASKGSKDTLVLAGDKALIVSVKNHTIVTVMDKAAMKENVFTNIDSTVVI